MTSRGAHKQSEKPLVEGHYITKCTFHFPLLRIRAVQFFIQTQLGYLLSCYCILELIMKNITSLLEIITEEYNNSWCFSDLQGHNVKLFWTCSGLENVNHTFIFLSTFQVLLLIWPMPGKLSSYIKLLNYWSCKHGKHRSCWPWNQQHRYLLTGTRWASFGSSKKLSSLRRPETGAVKNVKVYVISSRCVTTLGKLLHKSAFAAQSIKVYWKERKMQISSNINVTIFLAYS